MNSTAQNLLNTALNLPESERAELAARLIESLDPDVAADPLDADLDSAWDAEIKRRVEDLDTDRVAGIPWSEARRRILARSHN